MFDRGARIIRWVLIIGIGLLGLVACTNADNPEALPPIAPTRTLIPPTLTPVPSSDPETPTPTDLPSPLSLQPTATPPASMVGHVQPLIERLIDDLVTVHDVDSEDIRLLSVDALIWRDSSWGCPSYTGEEREAPTAGYRFALSTGRRVFVYHTDYQSAFFVCSSAQWLALEGRPVVVDPMAQAMVDFATSDAARRLEVSSDEVELASLLTLTWPDSSVGCPKAGGDYDDNPTPGYRLVLRAADDRLIYHTSARDIVFCAPEEEILPGMIRDALPTP